MRGRVARAGLLVAAVAALGIGCGDAADPWPPGVVDPEGAHHQYVISELLIPTTATEAIDLGLDIDYDPVERIDNGLAPILTMRLDDPHRYLFSGAVMQDRAERQIREGNLIILADVQATSLSDAGGVGVRVLFGSSPSPAPCIDEFDEVCGRHLDGGGSFVIDEHSPHEGLVIGEISNGRFLSNSGSLTLLLPLHGDAVAPTAIELVGARIQIDTVTASDLVAGRIGGGIDRATVEERIGAALRDDWAARIEGDCTGSPVGCPGETCRPCGCVPDSDGRTLLDLFDEYTTPGDRTPDCVLGLRELLDNSLLSSLLAPDVDLLDCRDASNPPDDCVFGPRKDEIPDHLSFGIGFSAVTASFPLPPSLSGE